MPLRSPATAEIYVVDDDPEVGVALGRLLRSAGFTVQSFTSAEAFFFEHPVPQAGVLILDVRMPGLDGPHMLTELRRRGGEEQPGERPADVGVVVDELHDARGGAGVHAIPPAPEATGRRRTKRAPPSAALSWTSVPP